MIEFNQPWSLLALLALPLLVLGQRRSLAAFTPRQRATTLLLRSLILLLLTLALAGLRVLLPSDEIAVLFVVDHSASLSPEAARSAREFVDRAWPGQHHGDKAGVVGFARQAEIWQSPAESGQLTNWPTSRTSAGGDAATADSATDLAAALDFASALLPADRARRLILLTDGNDTQDGARSAAARLKRSGTELWTVPLHNPQTPEVLVEAVEIPAQLQIGEPFDLTAHLHSNVTTQAKVRLYQSQFLIQEREVDLQPGDNLYRVPGLHPEGGFVPYEIEIVPEKDTLLENNRGMAVANLHGEPRILLVDGDLEKARPFANALQAEHLQVELRGANGAPTTLADLQPFDLFLLSDFSALRLTREQMELYRHWVQDFGGGFVLVGGENSFGVGGYFHTPIEEMLPVRMEHDDRQELPTVALLVILDRSGSMTAQVAGQTKISLADQGAALALNVLGPRDFFGVLAVDTQAHSVAPLARHASREPIVQKILSITAGGGGIYIYTSLAEALQSLRGVEAKIKHVILFSDAADAEEKAAGEQADGASGTGTALELASAMAAAKITTSVVALGTEQDRDTTFLRQLAEQGQGRFYLTSDATTLPQIFSTETMKVAQSSLIEEPTLAVPMQKSPLLTGLDWSQSPLLLGYNATKPKPTADIVLTTERGEPLLATWRYGLGQTAAFTSDAKARWASEWLHWPGYGKFWAQVVRGLLRKSGAAAFAVSTQELGDRLIVHIEAANPEGSFRNRLPITVTARHSDGEPATFPAVQNAPGSYQAELKLPATGTTLLQISSPELPEGGVTVTHTRSYPREFLTTETNEPLLRELAVIAGGRYGPAPAESFSRSGHPVRRRQELANWLLSAALFLFPVDIYLRRRAWRNR